MQRTTLTLFVAALFSLSLQAQVCDPTVAPTGLTSTYTPGTGALLEWNTVPSSVGVQLKVDLPSGSTLNRRIVGFERDKFPVSDALLTPGTYTWRVQAACSTTPPYDVTPISISSSFTVGSAGACPATVTDIDGNVYTTIEIDGQCWMQENLKVEHYRDGSVIPTGLSSVAWQITTSDAFAVYDNLTSNKATYGLLYNWFAVDDSRGLCPTGWHVPGDAEWTVLTDFLGGELVSGGKMKTTGTLGAGTGLWQAPNTDATNSSEFSGLPGGNRDYDGIYFYRGYIGSWWSSSEFSPTFVWLRSLFNEDGVIGRYTGGKTNGFSVRCLKD